MHAKGRFADARALRRVVVENGDRFPVRWSHIEAAVRAGGWDVLTLYRWPWENVVIERPLARTRLVPIPWTLIKLAAETATSNRGNP